MRIDVDRPGSGKRYSIPPDNPFLHVADARPETWAYGFRNPWRITMDRVTGDMWVGENGQDLWEYARIARRGENYGWPLLEGSHELHQFRGAVHDKHRPQGRTHGGTGAVQGKLEGLVGLLGAQDGVREVADHLQGVTRRVGRRRHLP